jgi:hypothetical protein
MTTHALRAWGIDADGIACTTPLPLFAPDQVAALRAVSARLDQGIGFSRERPQRLRGVQYLAPDVCSTLSAAGFVERLSEAAAESLQVHPAAHFGCSFNRTRGPEDGWADPWHLDAAAYTAVVLLSEPDLARGGHLCLFRGAPDQLWEALDRGGRAPPEQVESVPFTRPGEVVLFQGRRLAHAVTGLRGCGPDRLTLAVGLYVPGHPDRGLFPGLPVPDGYEEQAPRVEHSRAEVLALLDRARRAVGWPSDPLALVSGEAGLRELRQALARFATEEGD